jgi:dipeptidyl-peptidase-4
MNRKIIPFILALVLGFNTQAQDKMLSLEDASINRGLSPSNKSFNWLPEGMKYDYSEDIDSDPTVLVKDLSTGYVDTVFSLNDLNEAFATFGKGNELKAMPRYSWIDNYSIRFRKEGIYFKYNTVLKSITSLRDIDKEAAFLELHKGTLNAAYVKNNNLIVQTEDYTRKITYDGGNGIVYGQAVHRYEFGIRKGLFWSPEGDKLAFYRMDERRVTDYPVYDLGVYPAEVNMIKYPTAGDSSHSVTLGIFDTEESTMLYLDVDGTYDHYLTNITWDPSGEYVYVAWLNRGQNHMKLQKYDVSTGQLEKELFEERNDKYVEPEHGPIFSSNDPDQFVWFSERDGYNHLYLYSTKGKLKKQLTSGKWIVTQVLGFDESGDNLYFMGTKESPLESHLYAVNLKNTVVRKISKNAGTHSIKMNASGTHFIDSYSSLTVPRSIRVINSFGNITQELFEAEDPLADYLMGETTINPLVNGNTVLYYRMIKPPNFDPKKKYPVIVYLYGGPHAQMVRNTWLGASAMYMQYWAQQGYIVFTIDGRGSENRGFEFESATFRNLGTVEMEDQLAGVNYLKKLSYVDSKRMGIHGWSFGGFMTTTMMTRSPGIFKVGVAGGPVIDWDNYEIMYTERYMDRPEENPEGYKTSNLLNYIDKLDAKLLMIHGTDDDVVLWQHSMLYTQKAVTLNNQNVEFYYYPGYKHHVRGHDRLHLITKISNYLFDNL